MSIPYATRWLGAAFACALLAPGGMVRAAAPGPRADSALAEAEPVVDPVALQVIRRAGDFLRGQQRVAFEAEVGFEVVQRDGRKLEFGASRRFWVERPNRFRVEAEDREGQATLVVFDGRALSAADLGRNVYAQAVFPTDRTIDDAVDFARRALALPLPLGELVRNEPNEAMTAGVTQADLVGVARIGGVVCDHVALSNPDTDAQLWIAQGDPPTLRRVVLTYRTIEGAPAFWANLAAWSFPDRLDAERFRFSPAPGAERLPFAVRGGSRRTGGQR